MAWECLSNREHDELLSQRLSGRSSFGCGASIQHHIHEEPRQSPLWSHLLPDLLVTHIGHEIDGSLQQRQCWNLGLSRC